MDAQKHNPVFNRRIFWDISFDTLDYDKRARFVIERVFERGDVEDIRQCRRYYGDELIKEILTTAKWLMKETVYFASAIPDDNLPDYKRYNAAQLNPQLWSY